MFSIANWRAKLSQPLLKPDFTKEPDKMHRFIIELARKNNDKIASLVDANQGKVHYEIDLIPSLVVEFPYTCLEELARLYYVKKIWHDEPVFIRLDMAVPAVGGATAHGLGFTGKGTVIAILDTGLYPHKDFTTPENRILEFQDLINKKTDPYDDNGHGTHVGGIIAGNGISSHGKFKGMAPEAKLVPIKVLDEKGGGFTSTVLTGIQWCLDNFNRLNIQALNMSFGSKAQESYKLDPLCRATTAAWNKGLTICVAAGNEGPNAKTIDTPGINPKIITVGNVDEHNTLTNNNDILNRTSSRGPTIDNITKPNIVAPGTKITSTWLNGNYRCLSGTSMAAPMVTGATALILQKSPSLKPDQIKQLLMKNAHDLGLGPNLQGAGVLNLASIFNVKVSNKIHSNLKEILGYHLLETMLNRIGIKPTMFQAKRDEAIKKTVFSFLKSYLIRSL